MDKKILIVAIIVVVAILIGLVTLTSGQAKEDTAIKFLTNSTLKNGDTFKFQLSDSKGNPISHEEVIIALENNGTIERYSVTTDANGTGGLTLKELAEGNYKINVTYNGNDKYKSASAVQAIIVGEGTSDDSTQDSSSANQTSTSSDSSSSSSSSSIYYDESLNVYYNDQGIVVDYDGKHPMEAGSNYNELVQRSQQYSSQDFN